MKNDVFEIGDEVRYTTATNALVNGTSCMMSSDLNVGHIYHIREIGGRSGTVYIKLEGLTCDYAPGCFELAKPKKRLQPGDRVRVISDWRIDKVHGEGKEVYECK